MNKIYARRKHVGGAPTGCFRISMRSDCIGVRSTNSWAFRSAEARISPMLYLQRYEERKRASKVSSLLRRATLVTDFPLQYEKHNNLTPREELERR